MSNGFRAPVICPVLVGRERERARSIEWRGGEAFALAGLALTRQHAGEFASALSAASMCLAIAEELEHQQWQATGHLVLGGAFFGMLAFALLPSDRRRRAEAGE